MRLRRFLGLADSTEYQSMLHDADEPPTADQPPMEAPKFMALQAQAAKSSSKKSYENLDEKKLDVKAQPQVSAPVQQPAEAVDAPPVDRTNFMRMQ